jgi:hypothetical protein
MIGTRSRCGRELWRLLLCRRMVECPAHVGQVGAAIPSACRLMLSGLDGRRASAVRGRPWGWCVSVVLACRVVCQPGRDSPVGSFLLHGGKNTGKSAGRACGCCGVGSCCVGLPVTCHDRRDLVRGGRVRACYKLAVWLVDFVWGRRCSCLRVGLRSVTYETERVDRFPCLGLDGSPSLLGSVLAHCGAGASSCRRVSLAVRCDGGRVVALVGEDRRGWRGVLVCA